MLGAGSLGARFGKFGAPGDGGSADRLTVTFGLNSLACTPTTLGFCAVFARTAPSAGSSLWMRLRDRSRGVVVVAVVVAGFVAVAVVVAGLTAVVVAGFVAVAVVVAGFTAAVAAGLTGVAGLTAVAVAGFTGVVAAGLTGVAGLAATDVVAGLAAVVTGARTTGAGAARTTGAGARTTGAGAGAARTTGAGAELVVVLFLVSAQADGNAIADTRPASTISLPNFMTLPQETLN